MMKALMILSAISIIGIWTFMVYMNHLNKLIDKLDKKIDTLQYQTDDVLHDIDVVNKNIRNYYASLKKLEDEKIERKLDDINDKLNKLLLCQRQLPQETPSSPWYSTNKTYPWFNTSKVYCDNDLTNIYHVYKHVYASNIASKKSRSKLIQGYENDKEG